ncbi:MAG TPA: hypothetical protein ENJ18_04665 [Nannocystis exedens]|nr:hypothetical protein [Nannocystis exedens]
MRLRHPLVFTFCTLFALSACKSQSTGGAEVVSPEPGSAEEAAPEARSAISIYDALEAAIAAGNDSRALRDQAFAEIQGLADDGTAAYAFARAAVAGRVAEKRGLQAGGLVAEAETWARKAIEIEADFREGAATRMLGTLYVMAPPRMVEHGDSETGLEILEGEVEAHPDRLSGHIRLAEAYIALGDPEPGFPHLCAALLGRESLGVLDRGLLDRLVEEAGGEESLGCAAADQ